jgi:hypothetical protein
MNSRSAGCVIYEMICLKKAFGQTSMRRLHAATCDVVYSPLEKYYNLQMALKM